MLLCAPAQLQPLPSILPRQSTIESIEWPHLSRSPVQSISILHINTRVNGLRCIVFASSAKLHKRRGRIDVLRSWLEVRCHNSCPVSPGVGAAGTVEIAVRRVVREIPSMLRSLVRICAHICVCGSSSGGKGGRVCRRAASVRSVEVILSVTGKGLRSANRFVIVGGSKIHVPWGVGMSVAIHEAVGSGVSLVDIGLAGSSGRVRWSHSPAERIILVTGRDWEGRSHSREVLSEAVECIIDGYADCILQSSAGSYSCVSFAI